MTREEAIEILEDCKRFSETGDGGKYPRYYALEMAIKALEQDPCEDCISKQALQEWIKDKSFGDIVVASEHNFDCLPPVKPQEPKWIPCSERLPEEGKDVLACFYTGEGNYKMMVSRRSDYNYWSGVGRTADMVAWMPLPAPYKPQESEDK